MLSRRKDSMKSKSFDFGRYKQRNMVSLLYLQCKLQEYGYVSRIFKLKCKKMVRERYLETTKQQKRYRSCF